MKLNIRQFPITDETLLKVMNGYNSGTEPCQMPLMKLIETCLFDTICTEGTTERFTRLYGAGDYWHTLEESIYQLGQLFVICDVAVLRRKVCPFPILMISISDGELQTYGRSHTFREKVSRYRELVRTGISMKRYKEWHKKEVTKFSFPP